jgi:hypothetical protein
VIIVTPDTYHGTRVVTDTETHNSPVSGTVTDQEGNTADIDATVKTTTTSSTAVPYSFDYGIYTLSVERQLPDGKYVVLHRFEQKGIYNTLYGVPLGGKGHHPAHAVIEEAAEWISRGGLAEAERTITVAPTASHSNPSEAPASSNSVLSISSTPSGAEIEIDGNYIGDTPTTIQAKTGPHVLTIKKSGFAPWERRLDLLPGNANVSPELQLTGK